MEKSNLYQKHETLKKVSQKNDLCLDISSPYLSILEKLLNNEMLYSFGTFREQLFFSSEFLKQEISSLKNDQINSILSTLFNLKKSSIKYHLKQHKDYSLKFLSSPQNSSKI